MYDESTRPSDRTVARKLRFARRAPLGYLTGKEK